MAERRYGTRMYDFANGQKISYTATDADTTAFAVETEVAFIATTDCFITTGTAPTAAAAAGSLLIPGNTLFHFWVKAADKISVVRASADGSAYIVPTL